MRVISEPCTQRCLFLLRPPLSDRLLRLCVVFFRDVVVLISSGISLLYRKPLLHDSTNRTEHAEPVEVCKHARQEGKFLYALGLDSSVNQVGLVWSSFLRLLILTECCGPTQLRPLIVSPELGLFSEPVFGSTFSVRRLLIASVAT